MLLQCKLCPQDIPQVRALSFLFKDISHIALLQSQHNQVNICVDMRASAHRKTLSATHNYARNWYYFHPWQTMRIYKGKYRDVLQMGYFHVIYFFLSLPSELQILMKNKKWDFKVMDAYHQAYITNSKTQPPARIFFNKTLDINTHSPSSPRH